MPEPLLAILAAGLVFVLAVALFWPGRGLVHRWRRMRSVSQRVAMEDALKYIHEADSEGRLPTITGLAGALGMSTDQAASLVGDLSERGLVALEGHSLRVTPEGRGYALQVLRAHRLFERYLADKTGYHETEWHGRAHHLEHSLTPDDVDALAAQLGHPTHDPHGDPIPDADGHMVEHGGTPLTSLEVDVPLRIVHLEDEPEAVYAQLVAEGLQPGMIGLATEISSSHVRLWADGDEHVLAPIVAANIHAVPVPTMEVEMQAIDRLSDLAQGQRGVVVRIAQGCRGPERRRLLDLGMVPGTIVEAAFSSPTGNPMAYSVRGALIAIRRRQASQIQVRLLEESVL
jgi:DtxR family Mn-dependent transcriptional regulator